MVGSDRVILLKQVFERWWLVIICDSQCSFVHLIYFIVKASTMEHPNLWAVSKLQFYESFHYHPFLSTFVKDARRTRALSFWHAFLQRLLTCSSNFKSLSIVIPRSISFVFDSMEEPSISAVDGSLQLNRMWLLSPLAFIKLLLNNVKSGSDDASN